MLRIDYSLRIEYAWWLLAAFAIHSLRIVLFQRRLARTAASAAGASDAAD